MPRVNHYPILFSCLFFFFFFFFLIPFTHAQQSSSANPNTTTTQDHPSILKYEPSKPGNYTVGILYTILSIAFFTHILRLKDWWALCLPLGSLLSAIGFFIRPGMHPRDLNIGLFITQQFFVVISPATFLAFNYMLYGRFLLAIDPQLAHGEKSAKSRFSLLPPRLVARIFIWSDISTFVIQGIAGGLQAAGLKGGPVAKAGDKIFLLGVTLQGISYLLFTTLLTLALYRLYAERASLDRYTILLSSALYFSSLFIIIRSIYRIVEFAQGYFGYLIGIEVYLFVLDAAPLLLAISVWAFFWPSYLIERIDSMTRKTMFE